MTRTRKAWTEDQHQQALAEYLDIRGMLWCHVPNEGKRGPKARRKLLAMGLKAGVPDVLVFNAMDSHRGLAIELKRPKSRGVAAGKLTQEQAWWIRRLRACGWAAHVCFGWQDAVKVVEDYYGQA